MNNLYLPEILNSQQYSEIFLFEFIDYQIKSFFSKCFIQYIEKEVFFFWFIIFCFLYYFFKENILLLTQNFIFVYIKEKFKSLIIEIYLIYKYFNIF